MSAGRAGGAQHLPPGARADRAFVDSVGGNPLSRFREPYYDLQLHDLLRAANCTPHRLRVPTARSGLGGTRPVAAYAYRLVYRLYTLVGLAQPYRRGAASYLRRNPMGALL